MNKILRYTMIGAVALTTFSCSDINEVNKNPNSPADVPSNMIMEGAEKWAMDNVYDLWFSGRQCLTYSQQWVQRNYTEEDRYQIRETVNNSYFNYLYMGLANFDKVITLNTDEKYKATNSAYGSYHIIPNLSASASHPVAVFKNIALDSRTHYDTVEILGQQQIASTTYYNKR